MNQLQVEMQKTLQQLQTLLSDFEQELQTLPEGSLSCKKRNDQVYYYRTQWVDGKQYRTFLSKNDSPLIRELQRRRFIEKSLPILKTNVTALESAVKKYRPYDPALICEELSPAYREIKKDSTLWLPNCPDLRAWMQAPYQKYMGYPDSLIHETAAGLMVRSKAESMIADTLTLFGIPYRYEQIILANNKTYAPDFTMLHPASRKLLYWEHHGKMDDTGYVLDTGKKIMDYRQAGIKPGDNLILTFENKDHPLTMREIQDTIALFLL